MDWLYTFLIGITAVISAFGGAFAAIAKTKKQIEETLPKKIRRQSNIDMDIIKRMEQLKELVMADRVQIYDFHNGEHYANGRSALKTTCTYEVVRQGISSYQLKLQALPLSCIPRFLKALLDQGTLEVNNLDEIKDNMPSTYNLKKEQGIKAFYDVVLHNKEGEAIGFIGIQYVDHKKPAYNNNDKESILKLKFFIEENLEALIHK